MNRWPLSKVRQYLHYHGQALTPREHLILIRWYGLMGERLSYEKMGKMFDITPVRVAQIRKVAEWKLEREQEMWEEDVRKRVGIVHRACMLQALRSALELKTKNHSWS